MSERVTEPLEQLIEELRIALGEGGKPLSLRKLAERFECSHQKLGHWKDHGETLAEFLRFILKSRAPLKLSSSAYVKKLEDLFLGD